MCGLNSAVYHLVSAAQRHTRDPRSYSFEMKKNIIWGWISGRNVKARGNKHWEQSSQSSREELYCLHWTSPLGRGYVAQLSTCHLLQQDSYQPLGLELKPCVNSRVGSGNRTWALCKSSKYPYLLSHLISPSNTFFLSDHNAGNFSRYGDQVIFNHAFHLYHSEIGPKK